MIIQVAGCMEVEMLFPSVYPSEVKTLQRHLDTDPVLSQDAANLRCSPSPCQNGGYCMSECGNSFRCSCPAGRTGVYCECWEGTFDQSSKWEVFQNRNAMPN